MALQISPDAEREIVDRWLKIRAERRATKEPETEAA